MSDALRELIAVFGIKVDGEELHKADKEIDSFAEKLEQFAPKLKKIGAALAEAFGAEQLKEFVEQGIEAAAHVQDLANRLDVSAHTLAEFGAVAASAGVDFDSAARAIGFLEKNLGEAETKGGEAAAALQRLGISAKGAAGKELPELLGDVAEGLAKLPNQNQRAAAAMALFGREGRSLLPILGQGREALEAYLEEIDGLSNGLGDQFYADTKKAREEFEHFSLGIKSLKERALDAILPAVTILGAILKNVAEGLLELDKNTHVIQSAMIALATAIGVGLVHALVAAAGALWALIGPTVIAFGPIIAAALAFTWVIQDLWNLMTGGVSVIGNLIDKLGGIGARVRVIQALRDLWDATKEAINDAAYALGYFLGVFAGAGEVVLGANGSEVERFFLRVIDYILGASRLLVGFVQALEAIPKAIESGSFEPIGKVIDKAGNAVFGKGGVLEDKNLAGSSSDVTEHGVPQSAVDEWNKHHQEGAAPGGKKARGGARVAGGTGPGVATPVLTAAPSARLPTGAAAAAGGIVLHQENKTNVVVHTSSDQPRAVGDAVGAGVATANQKDLSSALAVVARP